MTDAPRPGAAVLRARYAEPFARVALENFTTRYPYAAHHTTTGPDDLALPVERHPAFASSYDWHSSVHMHWLATRLLGSRLSFAAADALAAALQSSLAAENLAVEAAYLRAHPLYERPYGWGWALALAASVTGSGVPAVATLAPGFAPLVDVVCAHVLHWVATAPEPVRHGVHGNSAFGLRLALGAAHALGRGDVVTAVTDAARRWFLPDRSWPFRAERSGQDFLSPGLAEADLMAAVLPSDEFADWAGAFLAELRADSAVLTPARVVDEHDGQQVHLFGLGLSSAASAARIAAALRANGANGANGSNGAGGAGGEGTTGRTAQLIGLLEAAAPRLLAPGLEASVSDEFMSSHWLATFAWDAFEALRD